MPTCSMVPITVACTSVFDWAKPGIGYAMELRRSQVGGMSIITCPVAQVGNMCMHCILIYNLA